MKRKIFRNWDIRSFFFEIFFRLNFLEEFSEIGISDDNDVSHSFEVCAYI
jgi:hypothetical protein